MSGNGTYPLVSIVIPVYNGSNYLAEAIDSALAQSYRNVEVIVVNDGSNDGGKTRDIALSYGNNIRYFEKENGGVATALNLGIEKMQGEYFSWLSHDDLYDPRKVEVQVKAALSIQEPAIVYSNIILFFPDGKTDHRTILPQAKESMRCFLPLDVTTGLNGCSLLIPRALFKDHGNFNPALRYTQDYDLWFRFASQGVLFLGVEERLVLSRYHPGQDSKRAPQECAKMADDLHASMMQNISESELRNFVRKNLDYVLDSYRIYKLIGYFKTAAKILTAILKYADSADSSRLLIEFIEELLQHAGQDLKTLLLGSAEYHSKRKKRLLFYSNVFVIGGIERVISVIAEQLKEDYDIYLVSGEHEPTGAFPLPKEVRHLKILNADYGTIPERLTLLSVALGIDLFIGCPNLVERFLDTYPMLSNVGIKTIAWNHYFYFLPLDINWAIPVACKRNKLYETVSAAVWPTSFSTDIYSSINPNGALMPNPNTFSGEPDPADLRDREEKIVLCIGRFRDSIKRIDLMLKVFSRVLDSVPDAKLYLVGDYDLDARVPSTSELSIRDHFKQLGLDESRVYFAGERDNVRDYYRQASILMMTSDSEGFGMVLVEAAHMGVPAILFEIPGLQDIVQHGKTGYFVPRDNIDTMANKIADVLADNALRRRLGANAQEMSRRFSPQVIGQRWKDLIETILECDNQTELNALLLESFRPRIEDHDRFMRQVVQCYEQYILKYARSAKDPAERSEELNSHPKDAKTIVSSSTEVSLRQRLKKYRIVRFAYYQVYKPHIHVFLRRGKNALLRFSDKN